MIGKQQILELTKRREALYKFLHIQDKQIELKELEEKSNQIEFWDNPKQAQKLLKKLSVLKSWIKSYCLMENNIEELKVLVELEAKEKEIENQYDQTKVSLEDLEFKNMLSAQEDEMPAILTINPGAGGTESQDWAEMIMRMYLLWGEKHGKRIGFAKSRTCWHQIGNIGV